MRRIATRSRVWKMRQLFLADTMCVMWCCPLLGHARAHSVSSFRCDPVTHAVSHAGSLHGVRWMPPMHRRASTMSQKASFPHICLAQPFLEHFRLRWRPKRCAALADVDAEAGGRPTQLKTRTLSPRRAQTATRLLQPPWRLAGCDTTEKSTSLGGRREARFGEWERKQRTNVRTTSSKGTSDHWEEETSATTKALPKRWRTMA